MTENQRIPFEEWLLKRGFNPTHRERSDLKCAFSEGWHHSAVLLDSVNDMLQGIVVKRNETLTEALEHALNCGVCKSNVLCWEGHRLYVAAGVQECHLRDGCYVHGEPK